MESALGRRLTAEFIGTALLVLFGTGSVVVVLTVGNGQLDYAALGFVGLAVGIVARRGHLRFRRRVRGTHQPGGDLRARRDWAADLGGAGSTRLGAIVSYVSSTVAEALGTFLPVFMIMTVSVNSRATKGICGAAAAVVYDLVARPRLLNAAEKGPTRNVADNCGSA